MVLHKTMTMPTSCTMCWISATCEVWVSKTKRYEGYNKRLDECPLEEVEETRVVCNKKRITAYVRGEQDAEH